MAWHADGQTKLILTGILTTFVWGNTALNNLVGHDYKYSDSQAEQAEILYAQVNLRGRSRRVPTPRLKPPNSSKGITVTEDGTKLRPSGRAILVELPDPKFIVEGTPFPSLKPDAPDVLTLDMVRLGPGTFKLGSQRQETRRNGNEGPVQSVSIDYTFEIGRHEVTFTEWDRCVDDGGCNGYRPDDEGWGRGDRPVVNISWEDAQSYLRWLSDKTDKLYRLPSEAEWEYAARAHTTTPFYTGESISTDQANYNGQRPYKKQKSGKYRRQTLPVGQLSRNPFGLYDMLGNAFEWTSDCWNRSHRGAPNSGAPRLDGDCDYRIMKGGSWVSDGFQVRAAKRTPYTTDYRYEDYGFRIARTVKKDE